MRRRRAFGLLLALLATLGADSLADEVPYLMDCRVADLDMDDTRHRFVVTWRCPEKSWAVTYRAVSARITLMTWHPGEIPW